MIVAACLQAQPPGIDPKMNGFIDDLMSRMTLQERIGQLNLLSVGFDVTGPQLSKDADAKVRQGLVGGVFNTYTPVAVRKLQTLALKESRLGMTSSTVTRRFSRCRWGWPPLGIWLQLNAAPGWPARRRVRMV